MGKRSILLAMTFVVITGCATTSSTNKDDGFVHERGLKRAELTPRVAPAKISTETSKTLIKKGYLNIGNIKREEIIKACWDDDCKKFDCPANLPHTDYKNAFAEVAASYGGDLMIMTRDAVPHQERTTKEGKYNSPSYSTTTGGQMDLSRPRWSGRMNVYGYECVYISSTSVWRYDPPLAASLNSKRKSYAEAKVRYSGSGGPTPVYNNGKYGYMNKEGDIVIEPKYERLPEEFSEGLALVKRCDYIDKNGKEVIPEHSIIGGTFKCTSFSEGLAAVMNYIDKWGYIDKTGKMTIMQGFNEAEPFSEGLAAVKVGDKWGYINKIGSFVITPQFSRAHAFSEGLAAVKIGDKWGYINKKGEWVIKPAFVLAKAFSEGLAPVGAGLYLWGYINKKGDFIIKPAFSSAEPFSEGLAVVNLDPELYTTGKKPMGYIDKTGRTVLRGYLYAYKFTNGLGLVRIDGVDTYIDRSGKIIAQE